jgi:hypothetical protein
VELPSGVLDLILTCSFQKCSFNATIRGAHFEQVTALGESHEGDCCIINHTVAGIVIHICFPLQVRVGTLFILSNFPLT